MPNAVIEIRRVTNPVTFIPNPVNIAAGDSVNWVNRDSGGDQAGAHQLAPVGARSPTHPAWAVTLGPRAGRSRPTRP